VAGRLLGLDAELTHAFGIAGSLCAGLLEFSKSGGGMVKRMHIGRAAESGVMAAMLARSGFTGPATVLEGKFGYLNVYCRDGDATRFTSGLGQDWNTLKTALKRYACHVTAHVPSPPRSNSKPATEFPARTSRRSPSPAVKNGKPPQHSRAARRCDGA
jgi:2-methylcitrate dehydratase PrpD